MRVTSTNSTLFGGVTPICNECGILLCWDISDEEYEEDKRFWDSWICQECNKGVRFTKEYYDKLHKYSRTIS